MAASVGSGEILIIKQVAEYLKVIERTIYRLAAAKKIPTFKVGGTWRFSRADIDSWIRRQSMEVMAPDLHRGGARKARTTLREEK
jgi:excisionase family DNA binding protein